MYLLFIIGEYEDDEEDSDYDAEETLKNNVLYISPLEEIDEIIYFENQIMDL